MKDIQKLEALINLCKQNENFYYKDHTIGSHTYRIFNYRIVASYSDWLLPMARECRGHTYLIGDNFVKLVSNPMPKFFNLNENPLSTFELTDDFLKDCQIYEKLDGSLISTVWNPAGKLLLKSKTSFTSDQAVAAMKWIELPQNKKLFDYVQSLVNADYTVNFEWTAPDNQVVVKYDECKLTILNARCNQTGLYLAHRIMFSDYIVKSFPLVKRPDIGVKELTGVEGYVISHPVHGMFKLKSDWYSLLHKSKDSLTYISAYEAALTDTIDDLIALFSDDVKIKSRLEEIREKAYNDIQDAEARLNAFHETYSSLDRKEYAVRALNEFQQCGLFSCSMNLYQGKDLNLAKALLKIEESKGLKL